MKGYYLWDWDFTKTIVLDETMHFADKKEAESNDAFKSFKACKKRALEELTNDIEKLEEAMSKIIQLKASEVEVRKECC